jgi:hypothetical protein
MWGKVLLVTTFIIGLSSCTISASHIITDIEVCEKLQQYSELKFDPSLITNGYSESKTSLQDGENEESTDYTFITHVNSSQVALYATTLLFDAGPGGLIEYWEYILNNQYIHAYRSVDNPSLDSFSTSDIGYNSNFAKTIKDNAYNIIAKGTHDNALTYLSYFNGEIYNQYATNTSSSSYFDLVQTQEAQFNSIT